MSGKGGVGKSTVAAYLAVGLARKGHQVGLMDVDLHGPSFPQLLGLKGSIQSSAESKKGRPDLTGEPPFGTRDCHRG
ncbi:MAG: P-loop NTPase [Deltaproteobacteria bacterium]|nr:P-loop NTPase [Deltaproteobacteria bacterium]